MDPDSDLATEHESLLQFLYLNPHGVAQFDRDGTISLLNPAFSCLAMPLLAPGTMLHNLIDLLESHLPELRALLETPLARGTICDGTRVHLGPAAPGQPPGVLALTVVRMNPDRHMAVLSDVTQQVAQEHRLRESEAWFAAVVQGADDYAVLSLDAGGAICAWNISGERLFGYRVDEVIGRHASEVITSVGNQAEVLQERLREVDRDGWHLDEGWRQRADGSRFWAVCMISPVDTALEPASPGTARYVMVVRDVTKRRHSADELRRALMADHLTGVLNRRCFLERAERELLRQARRGRPCYLAMVDADYFKAVNDTHGHVAGDAALCAIAEVLRRDTREGDLVGRLGGEEFAVLMPATDADVAGQVAERLRAGVAALALHHDAVPIRLTVSIGVAASNGTDLKQLLTEADAALYQAKNGGRDRVCRSGTLPP
jgi:diguanylate cyclase (GGDEF)-like protein/PAS domain S-box-containing protein